MTREDVKLVLQFFFTFAITAGSIITGAMLETGTAQMPRQAVVLLALLTGFGVATQRAMAILEGKPQEDLQTTVKQLVAQMRTVQAATAQVVGAEPEPAPRLPRPAPVTPTRVSAPSGAPGTPKEG
jgi:hypothetical protein